MCVLCRYQSPLLNAYKRKEESLGREHHLRRVKRKARKLKRLVLLQLTRTVTILRNENTHFACMMRKHESELIKTYIINLSCKRGYKCCFFLSFSLKQKWTNQVGKRYFLAQWKDGLLLNFQRR